MNGEAITEPAHWQGRTGTQTWRPGSAPAAGESVTQVSALCFTQTGTIVLVAKEDGEWMLPGGHPEPGEPWEDTLKRELYEEANAELLTCTLLGAQRIEGLTPEPHYQLRYLAQVRLGPHTPSHEITRRTEVTPGEFPDTLPWGRTRIGQALLAEAKKHG